MQIFKKLIPLLILSFLLLSVTCRAQSDSSLYSNKDIKQALILIEEGKGCCAESKLQLIIIDTLQARIDLKDKTITDYEFIDQSNKQIIFNLESKSLIKDGIIAGKDANISYLVKSLKRQKIKTVLVGVAGLAAVGYLLFK